MLMQAMRPHLTTLASRMEEMWAAGQLWAGERNYLCDAMLAASASGDPELRTQVCHSTLPLPLMELKSMHMELLNLHICDCLAMETKHLIMYTWCISCNG